MPALIKVTDTPNKDFVIVHPDRHPLIVRVEDAVTHPPEVHGSLIESPKVKVHDEADVAHGEYRLNLKFALPLPSPDYYTMLSRMILRDLMLKIPNLESQPWAREQTHALPRGVIEHQRSLQPCPPPETVERNTPEPPAPRMWPVASRRAALDPTWPPPRPPCPHFINRAPQVYGSTGPTFLAEVT